MIDPRLSWFANGATCSAVLFGWPWHPRFSRYSRMQDPDWRRSFNHENTNRPSGPPPLKLRRSGDPGSLRPTITSSGSGYRPIPGVGPQKPEFPPPREIPADWP